MDVAELAFARTATTDNGYSGVGAAADARKSGLAARFVCRIEQNSRHVISGGAEVGLAAEWCLVTLTVMPAQNDADCLSRLQRGRSVQPTRKGGSAGRRVVRLQGAAVSQVEKLLVGGCIYQVRARATPIRSQSDIADSSVVFIQASQSSLTTPRVGCG